VPSGALHTIRAQAEELLAGRRVDRVTFLIAVVIVQGMNYMEDQFANRLIGLNTFQLRRMPGINTGNVSDDTWREWMRRRRIQVADAQVIAASVRTPVLTSRYCSDRMVLSHRGKQAKDIERGDRRPVPADQELRAEPAGLHHPRSRAGVPVIVIGDLIAEKRLPASIRWARRCRSKSCRIASSASSPSKGTLFGLSMDKFAIVLHHPGQEPPAALGSIDEFT
jgi:putative ABC transport system permease protein